MIRFFLAMLMFAARSRVVTAAEWGPEDAVLLKQFLGGPVGVKLRAVLASQIASANERAAMKGEAFECGWACGYRGLFAQFEFLSAVRPDPDEHEAAWQGNANLEHLVP